MSFRAILVVLLLTASIIIGIAIQKQQEKSHAGEASDYRPDYTLHQFQLTSLKKDGSEAFTLIAPKLERNPESRELNIATPRFHFPDSKQRRWRAQSQTAWVNAEGSEVRLNQDVLLDAPEGESKLRLETSSLDVLLEENIAKTDAAVLITQPGTIIRGRGLEAQLDANRVTLKSEVRSRYVPNQ
ncbi:LPS export ABC transporter periplasmic protein LptC [Lysobacteraceae bacterium NML120232]|nr:LPS export ABC transporter periplasmic protein LptC [Xanthomonadaceae bacterium NML08-0793]PJK13332.1 LPS export ABC transporter periplasmic protein LptC [Xanthomonadaceae bacterium NML120232]